MPTRTVRDPVARALWYIESHFASDISLDAIAEIGGLSRFHFSRAFLERTGFSVMGYVRGRRLTEAARALCAGAPDILSVALDAGYGSHEAFTRAFREQFGVTPEVVRTQRRLDGLALVEAIRREYSMDVALQEPRVAKRDGMLVAGLSERLSHDGVQRIPLLWQHFMPYIGNVPGQVDSVTYGVCFNNDDASLEYMCGVEVARLHALPEALRSLRIPARTYAVFLHSGHISTIRTTMDAIWNEWLPKSSLTVVDAPSFERYGANFDPESGSGEVELWIPVITEE